MSQPNQDDDQNIRRSFVSKKTFGKTITENSVARNTSGVNDTIVPSRNQSNSSQMNQTSEQNNRRSFVPMAAPYAWNPPTLNAVPVNLPGGNSLVRSQPATVNQSSWNQMAGNSLVRNRPMWKEMAGNQPATVNQSSWNQMAGNSLVRNRPTWKEMAGNQSVKNSLVGNSRAGNLTLGNPSNVMAGKRPAGNPVTDNMQATTLLRTNPLARNSMAGIQLVAEKSQKGGSQVPNLATSTGKTGASVFPSSFNASPTLHEDQSGMYTNVYRQPLAYDRKNTIYRQNSPDYSQSGKSSYGIGSVNTLRRYMTQYPGFKKSDIFTPSQSTPWYQNYRRAGNRPFNYQQAYAGYPNFHDQPGGLGYQTRSGYQAGYPGMLQPGQQSYSAINKARDQVPLANDFKDNDASDIYNENPEDTAYTTSNTIQDETTSALPSYQALSSDETAAENFGSGSGFGSASGSGFAEPVDMETTADFQEPQVLSGSGSGVDEGFMNPGLLGGASDVAFMLAGTNNKPPVFPAPGLPMNLTRQQAIDIYKSAMYFAGLIGEGEWKT